MAVEPFAAALGRGLVGEGMLRGPAYRRIAHGAYMTADTSLSHGRVIQGLRAVVGPRPVLVGPSAAWSHGFRDIDPDTPAHMTGGTPRCRDGLVMHRLDVTGAVVRTDLGRATDRLRTAVDLARGVGTAHLGADARVALVDGYLRAARLPVADARAATSRLAGRRGLPKARRILAAARDGVDSVKETELRLLLARHGLPEPDVQCPVQLADGRIVARLDLGWPHCRVGCEYDGAVHRERGQHSADLARHNRIRAAGWVIIQVDARALRRPGEFVAALCGLIAAGPVNDR